MSKQEVKLILEDTGSNRILYARKKDGTEYEITVFEGGGYYTALWLRTAEEIADSAKESKKNNDKYDADREARIEARKVSSLAKLIMFIQRQKK